jgi:hypothetical protein
MPRPKKLLAEPRLDDDEPMLRVGKPSEGMTVIHKERGRGVVVPEDRETENMVRVRFGAPHEPAILVFVQSLKW